MKVARVEMFLVGHGWNNLVITRVHTDTGLSGLGEGTMQWQARTVAAAIDHMASRYVLGASPFDIERLVQAMYRNEYARGGPVLNSAIAAIEFALWDICGKALGQPVYNLLGGRVHDVDSRLRQWLVRAGRRRRDAAGRAQSRRRGLPGPEVRSVLGTGARSRSRRPPARSRESRRGACGGRPRRSGCSSMAMAASASARRAGSRMSSPKPASIGSRSRSSRKTTCARPGGSARRDCRSPSASAATRATRCRSSLQRAARMSSSPIRSRSAACSRPRRSRCSPTRLPAGVVPLPVRPDRHRGDPATQRRDDQRRLPGVLFGVRCRLAQRTHHELPHAGARQLRGERPAQAWAASN